MHLLQRDTWRDTQGDSRVVGGCRDALQDAEGVERQARQAARLLRGPGRGSGASRSPEPRSGRLLPRPRRAAGTVVGFRARRARRRRRGDRRAATGVARWPPSDDRGEARSEVRGEVGPGVRLHVLGAEVDLGAVGADTGSVGAGRGARRPRQPPSTPRSDGSRAMGRSPGGAPTASTRSTRRGSRLRCSASTPPGPSTPNSTPTPSSRPRSRTRPGRWLSIDARFLKQQQTHHWLGLRRRPPGRADRPLRRRLAAQQGGPPRRPRCCPGGSLRRLLGTQRPGRGQALRADRPVERRARR